MHSLVTGMRVNRGAGYGLCELSVYIFLRSADCGHHGEVILKVGDEFYCREVATVGRLSFNLRVNVWNVGWDEKSWSLWGCGGCREVADSRDSTL